MDKQEYLAILTEQIRCKKAHSMITDEIEKHIDDQTDAYSAAGMSQEKAVAEAVRQLGDPVEAGLALDRIHRPQTEWHMIFIGIALAVFGIVIQSILFRYVDNSYVSSTYLAKTIAYNLLGIGVMFAVYFLDYTFLGKHPIALFCSFLISSFFACSLLLTRSNQNLSISSLFQLNYCLATLFIPVFAGLIFHYRHRRVKGLFCCIAFLFLYALFGSRSMQGSVVLSELLICGIFLLTVAVSKGFFGGKKGIQLCILWTPLVLLSSAFSLDILFFAGKHTGLASYQVARIKALFSFLDSSNQEIPHLTQLHNLNQSYTLLGSGNIPKDLSFLNIMYNDYVVVGMFSYFGILLSVTVILVLFFLFTRAFRISALQNNRLGFLVGFGCSISFVTKTVLYLAGNLGYSPLPPMQMPFLSFGMLTTLTNFAMLGLLLSVYRHTNLISSKWLDTRHFSASRSETASRFGIASRLWTASRKSS